MRRFAAIGLLSVMLVGAHAVAAPPTSQAVIKRQLYECMARRMGANRTLSYNEAMRTCKERAQPPKDLASIGPSESGAKAH
jgi:hypothetical protein